MKGAILFCLLFAAALVSTTSAEKGGSITVYNSGGYVSFFTVDYTHNGARHHKESGNFSLGTNRIIEIPAGATEVYLKVGLYWFIEAKSDIFSRTYPGPVDKCFKIWGTTLNPSYAETSC